MKPLVKLAIVAGLQIAVLLCIVGFKAYTALTAETIVLRTAEGRPSALVSGSEVTYDISLIEPYGAIWDDGAYEPVYVEMREGAQGRWTAIAVHDNRERTRDETVLIKADVTYQYRSTDAGARLRFGIERIYIPASAAASLPSGDGHDIAVAVTVDRFGNATPKRFIIDGEPYPLRRW